MEFCIILSQSKIYAMFSIFSMMINDYNALDKEKAEQGLKQYSFFVNLWLPYIECNGFHTSFNNQTQIFHELCTEVCIR